MPVQPPAAKLPLNVRKNWRDEFENKKPDLEKQLSDVLGASWTIEADPLAIWPYNTSDYARDCLGSCIFSYVEGAISQLKYFKSRWGDGIVTEINSIIPKHILGFGYDETKKYSYNGPFIEDGKLIMKWSDGCLGTNVSYVLDDDHMCKVLNEAAPENTPGVGGDLANISYGARAGIQVDWKPTEADTLKQLKDITKLDNLKIDPNWAENHAILKKNEKAAGLDSNWQFRMGSIFQQYFEGLIRCLKYKQFHEDDMMQEALQEALTNALIKIQIVDKLDKGSYNETEFKDGALLLKSTPKNWTSNLSYLGDDVADHL